MGEHGTYAALATLRPGGTVDEGAWTSMLEVIDAREDCADFRVLVVLRLLLAGRVPEALRSRVERSVLGFRYWMSEPGDDSMCFWSENHQLIFATCELLAGRRFPGRVFGNDGRLGAEHAAAARTRLVRWLRLRQRFGFSEWLSPVYYEEDVAALVVLADHAGDPELAAMATGVLDLLLLDVALHTWRGVFSPSAGRVYERQKTEPLTGEMQLVVADAFGDGVPEPRWNQLGMLFVLREHYRVPAVLREIARSGGPVTARSGHGLDVSEAARVFRDPHEPETTGALLWAMEAFVTPGSVVATMSAYDRWRLDGNRFLTGLRALRRVPRRLLPTVVRALRPVVSGTALQRADVVTHRGVSYAISSAQHHQVRGFGDQQHLWQALLPGGVAVFATHPGSALVGDESRNSTPDAWVGNGVNPDVGQDGPVLLSLYDTRGRRGFGEKARVRGSHLYVPSSRLDTHLAGDDWLVLGAGGGLLGVRSTGRLVRRGDAYEQAGPVTAWVVVGAELADHGSPEAFRDWLRGRPVSLHRGLPGRARLTATVGGTYELGRGRLLRHGQEVPGRAGRYESPWVTAPDDPYEIVVEGETGRLVLDRRGRRE